MANFKLHQEVLDVKTGGRGLTNITARVGEAVRASGIEAGLCVVFIQHTSASLVIQENADRAVRHDLEAFFRRLVPADGGLYRHQEEGPDDMPAHIKAALTQTQMAIPLQRGQLMLGTWQGIYLFEHRSRPHRRQLALHLLGET